MKVRKLGFLRLKTEFVEYSADRVSHMGFDLPNTNAEVIQNLERGSVIVLRYFFRKSVFSYFYTIICGVYLDNLGIEDIKLSVSFIYDLIEEG